MCSCSVHEFRTGSQALNAISPTSPDPAETARKARHLHMLQELSELGMDLARAAAQQALADWNPPPTSEAPSAAPKSAGGDPTGSPRPRPDPGLTFARLSRAVRQTIALEARIAAGDIGAPRHWRANRRPADPRIPALRRVLHAAADAETDGAARRDLRREIDERLDDLTDTDPDGELRLDEILVSICDDLGIRLDPARLPDEMLPPLPHHAPWSAANPPGARGAIPPLSRPSGHDPP